MESGKCPLCGGELEYHGQVASEDCVSYPWKCKNCGAEGIENAAVVFDCHSCVRDADDIEVELHQPSDWFWVSWITQDRKGVVSSLGVNTGFTSLERAMQEVKFCENIFGDKLIAIWVERHNEGKKLGIPFHKVYVDPFGDRRRCGKCLRAIEVNL